jgi:L-methionine (R)-S-oxide reductase
VEARRKRDRYERIMTQLDELFEETVDLTARMATAAAILHAKMPHFSWTGFYLLRDGRLTVGPYQGSLACLLLPPHTGVCWTAIDRGETIVVPDVRRLGGHIVCDPRSRSEIVVPLRNPRGEIIGVLDVDGQAVNVFDDVDRAALEAIAVRIVRRG